MDPVRYRILGTTQALRPDGNPVAVGGARLRALLAVLALRAGRSVPAGLLVEEVWAGEPPADAQGALQALVGRLRRALGADAIDSAEGGYRLAAAPDDVDLHRFERLTADGIRALADGDSAKAAVVLDDALALWQGPALADLPDGAAEAARWEARRLDAVRARHTAAIALGQAERSLPELTALCDAHPLDEPLQALRLRALREAGRTAQALAAYDGVRRMLADRLGTDPGPELRTLHAELLGHADRGDAGMPPRPVPPEAPSGAPAPAAPAPPPPPLGNLRARLTSFVGRENDIAAIRADLETARLVTLLGPGGAGKTRLSQEAAEAVRDASRDGGRYASGDGRRYAARDGAGGAVDGGGRHGTRGGVGDASGDGGRDTARDGFGGAVPDGGRHGTRDRAGSAAPDRVRETAGDGVPDTARDGVWLAELAPVADPDAVPQAVLTAVGARETVLYGAGAEEIRVAAERHDDPLERLIEHCARRRMLIVLDNCEHVVGAAARLVEELLARCPEVTVLATSREPLGVPGEVLRPLDPLPEPVALRLLADRGAAARPGFRTDADGETAAACAEICRRLDGLPLAIELAAARLRMLTPRQIADRLDDRFRLLTSGSRTVLPRQQTLRAVVDWSWDLLDEDERDVLARLSVFARGCDLDAVEAVCGPAAPDSRAGRDPLAPLDLLASLVDKSLVVAAPDHRGDMRYRLLETVAEYAGERLDESGRRAAAERAHLTYYRELARTTEPLLRGPGQRDAIDRFQLEYENLRTALGRAVAARDEQEALCLALSLVWYWQMRDLRIEARGWCLEVMALGPDPFAEPLRPAAPVWKSCIDAPPPMAGEILAEARRGVHLAHLACMDTEMEAWQTATSQNKLRRIAETYEPGQPQTCRAPGLLWFFAVMMTGAPDRIRAIIDASVDTCRRTPGYEWELASCLQMRANILANRADWAGSAFRDAAEALEIFRRLGDAWGTAEALSARAEAHERLGAYREAAADYEGAIEQAERLGARSQSAVLAARLGSALLEGGEEERGERVLREVISGEERAVNEAMHIARLFLAGWLGATGRHAESREQLRLLREEFTFGHFAVFDCFILGAEAWLDAVDGRYTQSLTGIRSALERATDPLAMAMAPQMRSFYLFIAATSLSRVDGSVRAADAARCLGAAETLLPQCHVPQRVEREARDLATVWTRAALGDKEFERAYAEGGGLSYEEATALV
ncbi:winged helix-turn-helix domain-containing protein [Streptomyces sp. NBC_00377]|uniref:AfsR/SARP family transcriptional regulator n=1 Tax=unclassified Streptomyces TaxID=2593676 RepID=UPI002E23D5A3|nr:MULTISPECIES: BTAD domain-containing putative transcriptional regulator [unclassified Streptomyces]